MLSALGLPNTFRLIERGSKTCSTATDLQSQMPSPKHLARTSFVSRHVARVVLTLFWLAPDLFAQTNLTLRVSSETAPPGSTSQVKVFAATPALVTAANFSMDFDPQIFDGIASVAAFSAAGDQIGYANVNGHHVDAHFRSSSGGIGQLRSLPIFVDLRSRAGERSRRNHARHHANPTVDADGIGWKDTQGDTLAVTVVRERSRSEEVCRSPASSRAAESCRRQRSSRSKA